MEKEIQGKNEAWNRLSGGSQSNPGNKMEYPSHTNSRGYAGRREEHAEGDKVGGDDEDDSDDSEGDMDEKRCGGRLRHRHAYGQQPGAPAPMPGQSMQSPQQPLMGQQSMQPQAQPQGQFPQQQQPRALRRGGMV